MAFIKAPQVRLRRKNHRHPPITPFNFCQTFPHKRVAKAMAAVIGMRYQAADTGVDPFLAAIVMAGCEQPRIGNKLSAVWRRYQYVPCGLVITIRIAVKALLFQHEGG